MKAWFLSDIHIKESQERNGKLLLRFLLHLKNHETDPSCRRVLVLLGDIFDLWVGGHSYFANKFQNIILVLRDLQKMGFEIHYVEGNHDVHIGGFFAKKLGVQVWQKPFFLDLDQMIVRCEHGDLINPLDTAYLKYKKTIHHPIVKPLATIIPGFLWDRWGLKASRKSRESGKKQPKWSEKQLVEMIHSYAKIKYQEKPFDVLITGHMHIRDDVQLTAPHGNSFRSINLGSWLSDNIFILEYQKKFLHWKSILEF